MFVHDNGKIAVLANSRCGHQSMYEYFGIPVEAEIKNKVDQWISSNSRKVLVLRNPIERMWSGIGLYEMYAKPVVMMYDAAKQRNIDKSAYMQNFKFASLFLDEETRNEAIQQIIFKDHCAPYLHMLPDIDYEIIDFSRLGEYIPIATRTNITNCSTALLDGFIENEIFTKEDMMNEYQLYNDLLSNKKQLSPVDWKSLTVLD